MKYISKAFLMGVFFTQLSWGDVSADTFEHPKTWHDPQISQLLKASDIVSVEKMSEHLVEQGKKVDFDGDVFLVTLKNGMRSVFKSLPLDDQGDAQAEVAAYVASIKLGFPYVPPTVMRTVNGMSGSLQLFVSTKVDLLADKAYENYINKISPEDHANLRIFYFVFGQWDSGAHNMLAYEDEENTYLIAIDNSGIRNHQSVRYGELPFVRVAYSDDFNTDDWLDKFPFDKVVVITNPTAKNLMQVFGNKISTQMRTNFAKYKRSIRYVVYQNSLWIQYHAFDKDFVRAYSDLCPVRTLAALKTLDMKALQEIYSVAKGADFLNQSYLNDVLDRRDQVINFCENK